MSDLPKYRVKHGGLMRCCLLSLDNQMCDPSKNPPKDGDLLSCEYHPHTGPALLFTEGAWQWSGIHEVASRPTEKPE